MKKNNDVTALKNHLFDVIERLKSGADPDCDPKDAIPLEHAKAIADCAKVIVDAAKTEMMALSLLSKAQNPDRTQKAIESTGLLPGSDVKLIGGK